MYTVEIRGAFSGLFQTAGEAMAYVDKWARPFGYSWRVLDGFGRVYAQG
jgi:hypothetical protein